MEKAPRHSRRISSIWKWAKTRSAEKVAEKCRKSASFLYRWSSLYLRVQRVRAYGDWLLVERFRKMVMDRGAMLECHTGSEPVLPRMVQQKLEEHQKLMQENPEEFKKK